MLGYTSTLTISLVLYSVVDYVQVVGVLLKEVVMNCYHSDADVVIVTISYLEPYCLR